MECATRVAGEPEHVNRGGRVAVRHSSASGAPSRMVNHAKRELIRRGARNWLLMLGREVPFRFDIIELILLPRQTPQVNLLQNAFHMHEGRRG